VDGAKQRQCTGKARLLTKDVAEEEAQRLHKKYKAQFRAYLCPHCNYYHVGTNRTPSQQSRRWAATA